MQVWKPALRDNKTSTSSGQTPREQGEEWQVHYAFFARAGFTDVARAEAGAMGVLLVDLEKLDVGLRRALEKA